jgi:hypothetical protein
MLRITPHQTDVLAEDLLRRNILRFVESNCLDNAHTPLPGPQIIDQARTHAAELGLRTERGIIQFVAISVLLATEDELLRDVREACKPTPDRSADEAIDFLYLAMTDAAGEHASQL